MPRSAAARTARLSASTPRRCPSKRGSIRLAAQRPLPSMMMATCRGVRESCFAPRPSVMSAAVMVDPDAPRPDCDRLHLHDFFFFARQNPVDLGDGAVGGLLDLVGEALFLILADAAV